MCGGGGAGIRPGQTENWAGCRAMSRQISTSKYYFVDAFWIKGAISPRLFSGRAANFRTSTYLKLLKVSYAFHTNLLQSVQMSDFMLSLFQIKFRNSCTGNTEISLPRLSVLGQLD